MSAQAFAFVTSLAFHPIVSTFAGVRFSILSAGSPAKHTTVAAKTIVAATEKNSFIARPLVGPAGIINEGAQIVNGRLISCVQMDFDF